jgi:transcriptional regulator with XRE-family HTH domain
VTDLRVQLADFDTAGAFQLPRTGLGTLLRRLRHQAGLTLDQVGERAHMSRKGISMRELNGVALPAAALIEHLDALGYDVIAVPRAGATALDRRSA